MTLCSWLTSILDHSQPLRTHRFELLIMQFAEETHCWLYYYSNRFRNLSKHALWYIHRRCIYKMVSISFIEIIDVQVKKNDSNKCERQKSYLKYRLLIIFFTINAIATKCSIKYSLLILCKSDIQNNIQWGYEQ